MVEWTDDAIEAAAYKVGFGGLNHHYQHVRAALDAAVKAQGICLSPKDTKAFFDALENPPPQNDKLKALMGSRIRAEALEEAAKEVEDCDGWDAGRVAARIRALKDKPANQTDGGE